MFFQLLFIHLFRPFLKYKQATSPLPAHVSPRKFCTHAAAMISKLLRLYKRTYGLRQICNIAVYIAHSACTIHLLNLPEKNAIRDIVHGLKHLEEIAECWLCARRTLGVLHIVARRWQIELPEEAAKILVRTSVKFGPLRSHDQQSPKSEAYSPPPQAQADLLEQNSGNANTSFAMPTNGFFGGASMMNATSTAEAPQLNGVLSVPVQQTLDYSRKPRQQAFVLPQVQQELWNQDRASRGSATQTSPSVLFGGVPALIEDSNDWWYKEHQAFFANWNGMEQESAMMGNRTANGMVNADYANSYAFPGEASSAPPNGLI